MSAPIEGVVTDAEPICALHSEGAVQAIGHHVNSRWPAHTWNSKVPSNADVCKNSCGQPFVEGDRYICVENGIKHLSCKSQGDTKALKEI